MYFIRNAKNDEFATIGLALGITGEYQLERHRPRSKNIAIYMA